MGTRVSPARSAADFAILGLIAALVGAGIWMMSSAFLPVRDGDRVDYLFLAAPFRIALGWALMMWAALCAIHTRIRSRSEPPDGSPRVLERVAYAAPLALFGLLLVPLLVLVLPQLQPLPALCYLFVDLRTCFALGVGTWFLWSVAHRTGRPIRLASTRTPAWTAYAALACAAVAFGLASSPPERFQSTLIGNEPKYVRYLENFYQGNGFDISYNLPFDQFVRGSADRVSQISSLISGTVQSVRGLAADARLWAHGASGFNKAEYQGGSFVTGKNGGRYQVHTPGLSFLLYPFYYLDRQFLSDQPGYHNEFPKQLTTTSLALLGFYALWGLLIFRLLARHTGRPLVSWFAALTTLVTVPVAPFNFQYYPEVTAGILTFALCYGVLYGSDTRPSRAFLYGGLCGFLAWLHVRYLPISIVCAAGFLAVFLRTPKRLAAFVAGYVVCVGALGLYFYYITGSMLPTAMYDVMESRGFSLSRIPLSLAGNLLDRNFGILSFSPIYVLAFLGVRPFLVGRRRDAVFICLVAGSLVILSASFRDQTSGSATPARMIVAVTPFLAFPLAHAFLRFGRSRAFRLAAAVLWIMSVHNAYVFDTNLQRATLTFTDASVSGWKTTLIFPSVIRIAREADAPIRTAIWLAALSLIAVGAWRRSRRPPGEPAPLASWRPIGAVAFVLLAGGATAGALTRWPEGFRGELMVNPEDAKAEALDYLESRGCALCVSSSLGVLEEPAMSKHIRIWEFALDKPLNLSPDRDEAGAAIRWRLAALPPGPALLELHARAERADPSVVLTVTVFDRRTDKTLASREVRADELASSQDVIIPVYFTSLPDEDVRARLDYSSTVEVSVSRFLVEPREIPPPGDQQSPQ